MKSLRGIFPAPKEPPKRNFIKENVKIVKQKSAITHNDNLSKSIHSAEPNVNTDGHQRIAKRRTVSNKQEMHRSRSLSNARKASHYLDLRNNLFNGRTSTEDIRPQSRDASSQTERVDNELFLKDVIIRLPSATVMDKLKETESSNALQLHLKNCDEDNTNTESLDNPTIRTMHSHEKLTEIDNHSNHHYIKTSITRTFDQTRCNSTTELNTISRPNYDIEIKNCHQYQQRHPHEVDLKDKDLRTKLALPTSYRLGEVPKYLKDMKEKTAEQERLKSLININCPAGHIELTDAERTETLDIAKKKHQSLIDELNRMSLTSTTLRIKNRRNEIEKMLNKLDETIETFSRPTVYVKIN